jgi:RNA polymerase sigma-70 factor (ECF subfamily)
MTDRRMDRFEAFVREYQDMVFGTAIRMLGNVPEAEDIAQTVFLRAFEHAETVIENPRAAGWLKTVTTNLCLNHLSRYRARWQFFSELDRDDASGETRHFEASLLATSSEPLPEMVETERAARLEEALRRLPDHQRVPLVLFHFEERSYEDIAATLGVSLAKLKTDLFRGRQALRRYLGADGGIL